MQFTKWGYWRLGASGMLLGIAASAALAFSLPMWFRAEAEMAGPTDPASVEAVARAEHELVRTNSLVNLIQIHGLYSDELRRQPLEQIVTKMRNDITFGRTELGAFTVRFEYPDRSKVAEVLPALEAGLIFGAHLREGDVSIPSDPLYPKRAFIVLAGLLAGMAAGIITAHMLRSREHSATCPTCGHRVPYLDGSDHGGTIPFMRA